MGEEVREVRGDEQELSRKDDEEDETIRRRKPELSMCTNNFQFCECLAPHASPDRCLGQ